MNVIAVQHRRQKIKKRLSYTVHGTIAVYCGDRSPRGGAKEPRFIRLGIHLGPHRHGIRSVRPYSRLQVQQQASPRRER